MTCTQILRLALLVPTVALLGCSSNKLVPAKISGKLSYQGQPIKAGTLAFYTPDGVSYAGQISLDGTYSASDLPEGELVVTVDTEHLSPAHKAPTGKDVERRMKMMQQQQQPPPGSTPPEQPYIKLPEKYKSPKTSPLTVTLTRGRQVKDLDLVP